MSAVRLFLLALTIASTAAGELSVMPMKDQFQDPPNQYRMLQIIHGTFDNHPAGQPVSQLADNLQRFGYGGVVANVSFDQYLESEEHWEIFLRALNTFRAKGMTFWLYDEKGYPSGKAGTLTLRDHPEFECKGVVCARTEGTGKVVHVLPRHERFLGGPLLVVAMPCGNGVCDASRQVDLTGSVAGGKAEFDGGDETWAILSFHARTMYEGTHIEANYSDASPYIDIMDREGVARFIEVTHQAYRDRSGEAWKDIPAIFTDEPSLMVAYLKPRDGLLPVVPWGRHFRDYFQQRFDYDIVPELPKLFFDCGSDTAYKRLDFWRAVSELVEENYYGQIQDWCRANGIDASGHGLVEESLYHHVVFEGDLYRDLRRMDVPGIDMLSSNPTELARSHQVAVPKFVSSVTHMLGLWECQSETSSHAQTVGKLPCSYAQRRATIDYQYVLGLTRVTSYYGYDEFDDAQRREINDHIARLGYMLTRGKHVAEVGVYYPVRSMWAAIPGTGDITWTAEIGERAKRIGGRFGEVSQKLLSSQRDFDYLDDEAILEGEIRQGALNVAGEAFRCVVLPETRVLPLETAQKLEALVQGGGKLLVLGALPELGNTPEETESLKAIATSWASSPSVTVVSDVQHVPAALAEMAAPDVTMASPSPDVFYCHRALDDGHIYFFANLAEDPVATEARLRCTATAAERWDTLTGEIGDAVQLEDKGDGTVGLMLELGPLQGGLYVLR